MRTFKKVPRGTDVFFEIRIWNLRDLKLRISAVPRGTNEFKVNSEN